MQVTLISTPWALFNRPSIQLGCLKPFLEQDRRIRVRNLHPYLDVARRIGQEEYQVLSENSWAAEATYSALLFPDQRQQAEQLYLQSRKPGRAYPPFGWITDRLAEHLHQWLQSTDFGSTDLVGFSVCFSQLTASLLTARLIKQRWPHLFIVLGGSSCTPKLARSLFPFYPEVDAIIVGEGEKPLAELICSLIERRPCQASNVITAQDTAERTNHLPADREIRNLDDLPLPDYQDYFNELTATGLNFIPVLPLEFSRGCWWNRCRFCNLNLQWCGYRFKSEKRMLAELKHLKQQHGCLDFTFTDNALPPKEANLFFQHLSGLGEDFRFFAEVRILQDPATYDLYYRGGLRSIQIGIEALSDSLLARMQKGTTVLENVAALKYATEAGLTLDGNLILEFPGSTKNEVEETLRVLDLVLPFRPLKAAGFFLGYGSPVWRDPASFGIKAVLRHPWYRKLFPPEQFKHLDFLILSYRGDRKQQRQLWQPVRDKIRQWQEFHASLAGTGRHPLSYMDGGEFLLIRQQRLQGPALHHRLRGLSREIYLACRHPVKKNVLLQRFNRVTSEQLFSFLQDLERKKLLFCTEDSCLALAIRNP